MRKHTIALVLAIVACVALLALVVLCEATIEQVHHPGQDVIASMDGSDAVLTEGVYDIYTPDTSVAIEHDNEGTAVLTCFSVAPNGQTNVTLKYLQTENGYRYNANSERSGRTLWYNLPKRIGAPLHRWIQS